MDIEITQTDIGLATLRFPALGTEALVYSDDIMLADDEPSPLIYEYGEAFCWFIEYDGADLGLTKSTRDSWTAEHLLVFAFTPDETSAMFDDGLAVRVKKWERGVIEDPANLDPFLVSDDGHLGMGQEYVVASFFDNYQRFELDCGDLGSTTAFVKIGD